MKRFILLLGICLLVITASGCLPGEHRWETLEMAIEHCHGQDLACFEQILGPPDVYQPAPFKANRPEGTWRAIWRGYGAVETSPRAIHKPTGNGGMLVEWNSLNQTLRICDIYIYIYEGVHIETTHFGEGCGHPVDPAGDMPYTERLKRTFENLIKAMTLDEE